jgi:hypothetical protein
MGIYIVTLMTVRISDGRIDELLDMIRAIYEQVPEAGDGYVASLVAAGRAEDARPVIGTGLGPLPPNFMYSVAATSRAMGVVALGLTDAAEGLIAGLLPLRDQIAGANSVCLAMRPVAHTLGELCQLLGRREEAADHFAHAEQVALRWGSGHWAADAKAALAAV